MIAASDIKFFLDGLTGETPNLKEMRTCALDIFG